MICVAMKLNIVFYYLDQHVIILKTAYDIHHSIILLDEGLPEE